jgi:cobyrinic acid a,c-diamide synthase
VKVAGLIVNRAASTRHEAMVRAALSAIDIPLLGVIPKREALGLPDRHLGLVLPDEIAQFDNVVATAAAAMEDYLDLNLLLALSAPLPSPLVGEGARRADEGYPPLQSGGGGPARLVEGAATRTSLPPLGQHIAIARDDAFAFLYPHWLADWLAAGATLSFFSPLVDEAPDPTADAVFLPGGYPELHAARLAAAQNFMRGLRASAENSALIYGECGGFMVLGATLTDKSGVTHPMAGLLPHETRIDRPKRVLGYRRLSHRSPLPFPRDLIGHEFHYSSARKTHGTPLFRATDALGEELPPMGLVSGRIMGSYAHVIDVDQSA